MTPLLRCGEKGHSVRLNMAGPCSPEYRAYLQDQTDSLGVGGAIFFRALSRAARRLRSSSGADVFVLPSYSEGFSIASLEAMAHGLPCCAQPPVQLPGGCPGRGRPGGGACGGSPNGSPRVLAGESAGSQRDGAPGTGVGGGAILLGHHRGPVPGRLPPADSLEPQRAPTPPNLLPWSTPLAAPRFSSPTVVPAPGE